MFIKGKGGISFAPAGLLAFGILKPEAYALRLPYWQSFGPKQDSLRDTILQNEVLCNGVGIGEAFFGQAAVGGVAFQQAVEAVFFDDAPEQIE